MGEKRGERDEGKMKEERGKETLTGKRRGNGEGRVKKEREKGTGSGREEKLGSL